MTRSLCCRIAAVLLLSLGSALALALAAAPQHPDTPRAHDPRLEVSLFAASPDIVHPVGVAFDQRGRLLVIESHTHFRPEGYKGPRHDRIRVLEDTRGTGRADRFTTFYEGTTATMSIAAHPDGSIYIATRNEILRLRDTKGTGTADEARRIVFLDTKGNYPHNGLSGLTFDTRGNLTFGLGENLGADYRLVGTDGTTLTGGGEGGNIFWCTADGRKLRRVATGFWNPFGICRDVFGRQFAVDNDPDAMPPCRMVHVVEGGDYGYQFRYGRSGRHPFQSWDGQLVGTLPMVTGVGEAPCQVLSYESDGLPREYLGHLLVASWADHRIERYELKERGASVSSEMKPFVTGGRDFRPVGIAVAPDGSLFVSDWVKSDYNLHGQGAIWHVRARKAGKPDRPEDPRRGLHSAHRPLREAAARRLASEKIDFLRDQVADPDVRVRAASLTALLDAGDMKLDLEALAAKESVAALRALAVRALVARGGDARRFLEPGQPPAVRLEAIAALKEKRDLAPLLRLLADSDPFLRSTAIQQLARSPSLLATVEMRSMPEPRQRMGLLLAWRASGLPESTRWVKDFLSDADEEVRFLAAKWVADQKLLEYRPMLAGALKDRRLHVRLYLAYTTALARLDGREVNETQMAGYYFDRLQDAASPTPIRVLALQMIPAGYAKLTPDFLGRLLADREPAVQLEAARALGEGSSPVRLKILREAARNARLDETVRAQALLGLAGQPEGLLDDLFTLVEGDSTVLREEALRALVGSKLDSTRRATLEKLAHRRPETASMVARVLGQPFSKDRPPATDLDAWLKRLEGPADAVVGRRVFAHPRLAGCFRCHRVEGRGADIGPDLSAVGRNPRRHILESILQPSALIAPYYQSWTIETTDGKVRTGMLVKTDRDEYTWLDAKGDLFKVNTRDVVESRPDPKSIMPDGLADLLTDQELRDLMAYLESRR
jgi:putative membrane-bound dehydrogenase-like protein